MMRVDVILLLLMAVVACAQVGTLQQKIATPQNEVFHIGEPKQFARVIRSFLHLNSDDLICQAFDRQAFTNIHAFYRVADYLPDSPDGRWPTQIVAALHLPSQNSVYAALSTGTLVEMEYGVGSVGMLGEGRRWEMEGSNGSWVDLQLIASDDKLVAISQGKLRSVELEKQVWRWGPVLVEGAILKAASATHLYALARHRLTAVGRGHFLAANHEQLIDFAVNEGIIYLLSSTTIHKLKADSLEVVGTFPIAQAQYARKIAVNGSKVLVYYQRHQQAVLQEYRIEGSQLLQVVRYHHLSRVQSISLQGSAAVIALPSELAYLQLSLQTAAYLPPSDRQLTFGYDSVISVQVLSAALLMLVLPGEIQIVEVLNKLHGVGVFGGVLACSSSKKGVTELEIKYEGFCGVERLAECEGTVHYTIEVVSNHKQQIVANNEMLLLAVISFLTLISACLFLRWQDRVWSAIREQEGKLKRRQMTLSQQMITSDIDKMDKTEPDVSV